MKINSCNKNKGKVVKHLQEDIKDSKGGIVDDKKLIKTLKGKKGRSKMK